MRFCCTARICIIASGIVLVATSSFAQAYLDQLSGGQKDVYVNQAPSDARPVAPRPAASASRPRSKPRTVAVPMFPSVGRGSSAIVTASEPEQRFPTVWKGAVNR